MAIEDGSLRSYEGGWAEYVRVREEAKVAGRAKPSKTGSGSPSARNAGGGGRSSGAGAKDTNGAQGTSGTKGAKVAGANGAAKANGATGPSREERKRARQLEADIAKAEATLAKLEDELADPGSWSDAKQARDATERLRAARLAVDAL